MNNLAVTRAGLIAVAVCVLAPSRSLAQMGPVSVVAPVEARPVEVTQPIVASVEPVTKSTLATESEGLVAERSFDEGQEVKAGQVLARMKTDLLGAELATAEAARASAAAAVAKSEAQVENAVNRLQRLERLVESNAVTGEEVRDAATELKVRRADVLVQQATVEEKLAEVGRLKLLITKAEVKAPIDGVVSKRYVEVGQWVEKGAPVADVVWLDPLWVRTNVPEGVVAQVRPGDKVKVTIDALRGEAFEGVVDQVLPEADPASRTFPVKVRLDNPQKRVRPGFFARATFLSQTDRQLVVPKDAVVPRGTDAHVVAVRDGKAVVVPVVRGTAAGEAVAVTPLTGHTLAAEDKVVVRGNEQLRGGEAIMVVEVRGTAPATQPGTAPGTPAPATAPTAKAEG